MAVGNNYHEYPTSYNGTNVSSASDFFLGYPAYISQGVMAKVLPVFVFLALFALALPFGVGSALTSAAFISFILTTYLWWNGFLAITYPMVFLTLTIVSAIIVSQQRN